MSEQWQVDIARSESDRKHGRVEVAAYTSIGFDRRTVALVDRLEDARQIVRDHNAALAAATASGEAERLRAALEWYADEENYNEDHAPGCKGFMFDWTFDLGTRAREALADRAAGEREG